MAKKVKREKATETNGAPSLPLPNAPEGYTKQATDVVGFWDPDIITGKITPIHFIPLEVKIFDSKIEKHKPSAIVVGKLVDAIPLSAPGGEDEIVEGNAGDIVGVWYKPGMGALKMLANAKVFMYPTGELDTGKPNKMKTYDCLSKQKGSELQVTQDTRKQSAHVETSFAGAHARTNAKANAGSPPPQGDDDIPF